MSFAMDYVAEHMETLGNNPVYVKVKPAPTVAEAAAKPAADPIKQSEKPKQKPAHPPVTPEPPRKLSILSDLDASIAEARELNAARQPRTQNKSKNKERD